VLGSDLSLTERPVALTVFERRMMPFASGFIPTTPIPRFTSSGSTSFSKLR
jgi:hypothetical protein